MRKAGDTMLPMTDTVFIVDDDASVRKALRRLLKSAQYRVQTFMSAEEFRLSGFNSERGCLLLDIRLPGISGFELQEELLASGVQMPVVFVTGHDLPGMEERAMLLGAAAYLRKPFDEKALLSAVRIAIQLRFNSKTDKTKSPPASKQTEQEER